MAHSTLCNKINQDAMTQVHAMWNASVLTMYTFAYRSILLPLSASVRLRVVKAGQAKHPL